MTFGLSLTLTQVDFKFLPNLNLDKPQMSNKKFQDNTDKTIINILSRIKVI